MSQRLIGYYTADEADKINEDLGRFIFEQKHSQNLREGFKPIGVIDKDTPATQQAEILANAELGRKPTTDEISEWQKGLAQSEKDAERRLKAVERRRRNQNAWKAERARVREIFSRLGVTYKDFTDSADIESAVREVLAGEYPNGMPDGELEAVCAYVERELKEFEQRKGQRERRKARIIQSG